MSFADETDTRSASLNSSENVPEVSSCIVFVWWKTEAIVHAYVVWSASTEMENVPDGETNENSGAPCLLKCKGNGTGT